MKRLRRIARWAFRAWPFIIVAFVEITRWRLGLAIPDNATDINRWTSSLAQAGGGLVVLHSLSSSLRVFGHGGLWAVAVTWLKDFPWSPRKYTLKAEGGSFHVTGPMGRLSTTSRPTTTEERLTFLENQLVEVKAEMTSIEKSFGAKLDQLAADTAGKLEAARVATEVLSGKVAETAVGGVKQQVFGVLLALYGVGISLLL